MRGLIPALVLSLVLAACGDSQSPTSAQPATSPTPSSSPVDPEAAAEDARDVKISQLLRDLKAAESSGDEQKVADLERQLRDLEREEDEELEEDLPSTSFDEVIDTLPLNRPPLYVGQFMTEDVSHRLIVRPPARRFFCGRTPAERLAAVRSFYEDADRRMRKAGIRDFVLVVDALRDTGEVRSLAIAKQGDVRLTQRGRGAGPC